jgi:arsenate reductase
MTITVYGIPNCDQVKKARAWLNDHALPFEFHDFKKTGVSRALIESWLAHVPLEFLLNRKGTTWRNLTDRQKTAASDAECAINLMIAMPSLIKRPVLAYRTSIHVGFADPLYQQIFHN